MHWFALICIVPMQNFIRYTAYSMEVSSLGSNDSNSGSLVSNNIGPKAIDTVKYMWFPTSSMIWPSSLLPSGCKLEKTILNIPIIPCVVICNIKTTWKNLNILQLFFMLICHIFKLSHKRDHISQLDDFSQRLDGD